LLALAGVLVYGREVVALVLDSGVEVLEGLEVVF
jgi:hypothetical protein